MLTVKTFLLPSSIHGKGVFAAEPIPRGTVVWRFAPAEDLLLTEPPSLGPTAETYLRHFAFFDAGRGGFVVCGDNAKWMNHSDDANTTAVFEGTNPRVYDRDVAVRDIHPGEEITCDYRAFDRPTRT